MPIATNPSTGETVFLDQDGGWKPAQTAVNPQTKELLAHDGQGWVPVPAKSKGVLGYVDDAVRSLASGVTFGYADEIAARGNSLLGKGDYATNLQQEQDRDKQISPWLKIPGEVAGAVGGAVAAAPVAAPMAAASGLARLPGFVRAIGAGAAGGAAFGSGNADPGQRLEGAAQGGGIGALAGGALYPVVRGVQALGREVAGAFVPERNVSRDLSRAIQRDETTPEQLLARADELNAVRPGVATIADAGGENVRGLVERVAQTPGAGRTTVVPALTERQQGQMNRFSTDLAQLTGTRRTAIQATEETMAQRAERSRPLYDEALNFNATQSPELVRSWQEVTSTGYGQQIIRSSEFRRTLQTEYGIRDPNQAPLMVQIDAFKKAADDMVGAARSDAAGNRARVIGDMRDRLLTVVDGANPAYAKARDAWAGPSQYMDAIREGANILNTNISGEQLSGALAHLSDANREAFTIGAISAIRRKMGSDPARLADYTKYVRSPEMREKIAALMPTPEARQAWADRLNFEVSSSEMTGRALGNSATARRLAERADAENIVGDLVMDAFSGHPPLSLLRNALMTVPQRLRDTLRSRSDEILADLLTTPGGATGPRFRQALEQASQQTALPTAVAPAATINAANAAYQGR